MFSFKQFLILLIAVTIGVIAYNIWSVESKPPAIEYSSFLKQLENREIKSVHIRGGLVEGTDKHDQPFMTYAPDPDSLIEKMIAADVSFKASPPSTTSPFWHSTFPVLLLLGFWVFFMVRQQKGGGLGNFSKKKTRFAEVSKQNVTFDDVAGVPDAKEELIEIIHFLKDPGKYEKLGGKIPKGVLLQGPPGTGKTLLAKAIAGEAGVPFFNISGSDFVEMFVGVGASRVRDLFSMAKKNAPCIVFIDEIDAVGRHRGAADIGGQEEKDQTLNALLVEMDGFQSGETVIIVGATNRPDVLDPALMRPGRFDRQITILPPDVTGRVKILEVYARKMALDKGVQLENVARSTPGFTGADLANLMNESALLAARKGKDLIQLEDVEEARDRILMGAKRKGMVVSESERRATAYHESGHAVLAWVLPNTDPLHKVTIIPHGRAMGVTQQVPLQDIHSYSREYLMNRIKILLGGRTAEELVFNQYTTGASSDLQEATNIATKMVCEWGMSSVLGPRAYVAENKGYLGGDSIRLNVSEETAKNIDREINRIVEECYQEAVIILEGKINYLHKLAEVLLKQETIDAEGVDIIMQCRQTENEEVPTLVQL
ncbi:MAG: ATP-dependent zinc metalloprotease FtsH [Desulfobulbaceae bacterium]|jgi:cell division protease FtsH|nr:ATP-dependent zinc metalloprotease FtsH [Desulfobulbaceae bacterium]MDY0349890.1 ATP-dependent zinc metalloprotease FtsH [Desulfobulbaceae bacterium]